MQSDHYATNYLYRWLLQPEYTKDKMTDAEAREEDKGCGKHDHIVDEKTSHLQ